MSRKSRKIIEPQLPRFESNKAIKDYDKEKPLFKDSFNEIHLLLLREGARDCSQFNKELALDLDDVEKKQGLEQMDRTVDFVVGCVKNTLLMVEAKFRVKDARNLSKTELEKKIRHSRNLLSCEHYTVYGSTILLFNSDRFEQNKNTVFRLFSNTNKMVPLTVEGFYKRVFEKE